MKRKPIKNEDPVVPSLAIKQINLLMRELGAIEKDMVNKHQKYKFRGIDQVLNAINPLLVKHELILRTNYEIVKVTELPKGFHVILYLDLSVIAADGSGVSWRTVGEGADFGDKAVNKAMSAALKYAFFQNLCIPTEEKKDSEHESPEVENDTKESAEKIADMKLRIFEAVSNKELSKIRQELQGWSAGGLSQIRERYDEKKKELRG